MALHFIFPQCQVLGQASGFPLYIPAISSVLHLDLSEIHQKCDLITSPPSSPPPQKSVNMTPFYLLIHLDKQTMC